MNSIALFDLDDTLIHQTSLLAVTERYFATYGSLQAWHELLDKIKEYRSLGYPRKFLNQYFFQNFASISVSDMRSSIQQWFIEMRHSPNFLNKPVIERLHTHQHNGDIVMIVSGSFYENVKVVAAHLGIHHIVCNRLATSQGHYTGELMQGPVIGEGKVQAILRYLKSQNISGAISHAYGDHPSDIPMLSLAKHPSIVGENTELLAWGEQHNWDAINMPVTTN